MVVKVVPAPAQVVKIQQRVRLTAPLEQVGDLCGNRALTRAIHPCDQDPASAAQPHQLSVRRTTPFPTGHMHDGRHDRTLLELLFLGCVPRQETIGEAVCSALNRIEAEVILDFVPEVLAEIGPAVATCEDVQQWTEQAVVLIGREVQRLVVYTDGIPLVQQVAQLVLQRLREAPGRRRPRAARP